MTFKEGKYNIKAVSKKLGIRPGTLRAWERRYQVICPDRNESGHRLYTEKHIAVLQWLIEKVNEGFTIKQAVELKEASVFNENVELAQVQKSNFIEQLAEKIAVSLLEFDERTAQDLLNQAYSLYSIDRVTIELFGLIRNYAETSLKGGIKTRAHQQFCQDFLEMKISAVSLTLPVDATMPKALLSCGPNEQDALLLRMFSFYLKRKGMEVICIGAGISDQDVEFIRKQWSPDLFVLSCMATENIKASVCLMETLINMDSEVLVGLVGTGFTQLHDRDKQDLAPLFIGKSRADWELWLEQSGFVK